jgi:LDH2 family malate/lactate/ureidoglycolate dehydrogenase
MPTEHAPAAAGAPLDADTADSVRLSVERATGLGLDALRRLGYPDDEAGIIVDQLIDNALCGYKFAGLPRILAIAGDAKTCKARTPVRIVHETPVSATLDGGNNVGYIAAYRAAEVAIEKTRAMGIASVGASNSYFSGRNAYFVEHIVRAGYFALHVASGQPLDDGFYYFVLNPDIMLPGGGFARQMSEFVRAIKATPRQSGVDEIRIPSERALRERERRRREGIVLERKLVEALQAL